VSATAPADRRGGELEDILDVLSEDRRQEPLFPRYVRHLTEGDLLDVLVGSQSFRLENVASALTAEEYTRRRFDLLRVPRSTDLETSA
jgi:hypothetical protein